MGDNMAVIDLGTGFDYSDIKSSNGFTCISSTEGAIKCWGRNDDGQLGLGDTDNRGDGSNEMGDNLDTVDLGTDFNVSLIDMPTGYGGSHTVLVSNDLDVKAWGSNGHGQLGNNDETGSSIGDESGEMGDNLDTIDVDRSPTALPTWIGGDTFGARIEIGYEPTRSKCTRLKRQSEL